MNKLPNFSISSYKELLLELKNTYQFQKVSKINNEVKSTVFLRHDIDFFLNNWDDIPIIENELEIAATYYICLSQHYNIFEKRNSTFLKKLISLGHEIGLHYDLTSYPIDKDKAQNKLDLEIQLLSEVVEKEVLTIVMHQPFLGNEDYFIESEKYVNPMNPKYNKVYISDSCRAWRDNKLKNYVNGIFEENLLLTLHPELWLKGEIIDRIKYLEKVVFPNAIQPQNDYYFNDVKNVWLTHEAVKLEKNERI